jgi:uncharacterized protein (TIGR02001 family)
MIRSKDVCAALVLAGAMAAPASADDKREFKYSFNGGITTDYVFRGFSQTAQHPTAQGGVDLSYGILYAGFWASGLDYGKDASRNIARSELDLYAGIKPVWNKITFDLGAIYYVYADAKDKAAVVTGELDYAELKLGMSRDIWKDGTLASTYYWSPDYTNSTGSVFTSETMFTQTLPAHGFITPSVSAMWGYQRGFSDRYQTLVGNGKKDYSYWNAGVTLTADKLSFDLRYWDTNVKNDGLATDFCKGQTFQCDSRVIGTFKFTY